jgi:hypothetical protein
VTTLVALERILERPDVESVKIEKTAAHMLVTIVRAGRPSLWPAATLARCLSQAEGAMDPKTAEGTD